MTNNDIKIHNKMTEKNNEIIFKTKNLTKLFGKRMAVNDLNIEIRRGEVFGFLGPNGSGKSTTVGMLVGLVTPSSGSVEIFGMPLKDNYWRIIRRVGATIESPALYPYLSGWDNLIILAEAIGNISISKINDVLKQVNLIDRARDKYGRYSLGMKQRLAIAVTLLRDPELIILDEPTNGLDPSGYKEVRDLIPMLAKENRSVFLCSHMLNEVEKVCDRVAIIKQGQVLACDSVKNLLTKGQLLQIKVDNPAQAVGILRTMPSIKSITEENGYLLVDVPRENASMVSKILAENNIFISELSVRSTDLESVFLELTGDNADA